MKELLPLILEAVDNRNIQERGPWWAELDFPKEYTLADVTSARVELYDYARTGVNLTPVLKIVFNDGTTGYASPR